MGLIDHLARRIGGVRAGSGGLVWYLTHAGERLLRLHEQSVSPVRRFFEPSPHFLAHSLAVAEIAVQLTELCRKTHGAELAALQPEPECWRTYSEYGTLTALNHFGIEVEFTGITRYRAAKAAAKFLSGTITPIHDYYDTYQVKARGGRIWKFMYDGSITCQHQEGGRITAASSKTVWSKESCLSSSNTQRSWTAFAGKKTSWSASAKSYWRRITATLSPLTS